MNSNWFKLVMKMTKVEYGKNLLLKGVPIIFNKGGAKLKIGENVTIKSSFLSNLVGLYSRTIIVTRAPGAEIEIGNNVGISGATIYARKKITIGENTCIGGNCKILDNDFHPIEAEARNKLLRDENGGDSDLVPSREIKILQYIILNQPYVSKTLNRLNMQKCAPMLKFFESAQKRMDVLYHLLH